MKRYFIMFWRGLTGIIAGIANWITTILGMDDDSMYGRILQRIVATCFTLLMLLFTAAVLWAAASDIYKEFHEDEYYYSDTYTLSENVTYTSSSDGAEGYVTNANGKKTIKGIEWAYAPLGEDSLACYSDGKKRGYFSINTGKVVIKPQYNHAWVFSEGLAAVDDNGIIKFIDSSGKVVIDTKQPYSSEAPGYVFHDGYCVTYDNDSQLVGMIDRQGSWVLQPEYDAINQIGTLWIAEKDDEKSVLSANLTTIIPPAKAEVYVCDGKIELVMSDHTMRLYDLQGNLVEDFLISYVEHLVYDTPELRYTTTKNYNDDGIMSNETENSEPMHIKKTAKCMRYEAESGWYGLITAEGKVITPPSYSIIMAVGYDLYLCKNIFNEGILLNGKGERVN